MQEAVSAVLVGRQREAEGLSRMVTISLGIHAIALVAVAFLPAGWLTGEIARPERAIMISFAPAGTQDTGGLTPMARRNVQAEDAKNVTRTPATAPEMVTPAPEAKPSAKPVPKPPEKTPTSKPSTGKEVQRGPARADTPATSQPAFGGLSQGGSSGPGGVRVEGNFCCPEYLEQMKRAIQRNWNQNVGVAGTVELTLYRPGFETRGAEPLIDAIRAAHAKTFPNPPQIVADAVTSMWRDTNAFNELGIPAVSYAPRSVSHATSKSFKVADLVDAARVYTRIALELCNRDREPWLPLGAHPDRAIAASVAARRRGE